MKFLKGLSLHLVVGLNTFILFLLFFEKQVEVPPLLRVTGRLHPLVLHFPIVLLLLAAGCEFFKNRLPFDKPAAERIQRFFLLSGAVCAAFAAVLGLLLSREDGYSGALLQWHKWSGCGVSFFASLLVWGSYSNIGRGVLKAGMTLNVLLLLAAGHWGASLTHGENYVFEPVMPPPAGTTDLKEAVIYTDLLVPVLKTKCFSCHNPDKAKGKLVMTDSASLKKGGESGALYVGGQAGKSLLVERLLLDIDHKHRMPPKGKPQLSETEIALIKAWVDQGASFSARLSDVPENSKIHELAAVLYGADREADYTFEAADKNSVSALNNSYRLVAPVAFNSPALDVMFFNRNSFSKKALEEVAPVQKQVVHLNLSDMKLNDTLLPLLASFSNLRQLNLNHTGITDNGLANLGPFQNLQSLMLTGTNISAKGLSAFLNRSKPLRIYAWNTALTIAGADSLRLKYPGVQIETGAQANEEAALKLNLPQLVPRNAFFRQPFLLDIKHPVAGTTLIYTLDGREPDSVRAPRFAEPLRISGNITVKVRAIKKGWTGSDVVEQHFSRSSKLPDTFSLLTLPSPYHKGRGAPTLFDLEAGSTDILYASDGKWLGYQDREFAMEFGFNNPVRIDSLTLSTLLSVDLESFPPSEIEVWGWNKGVPPQRITKIQPRIPTGKTPVRQNRINCPVIAKTPYSQFRIVAKPLGKLPPWHPQAGKAAWLFIDEILIN